MASNATWSGTIARRHSAMHRVADLMAADLLTADAGTSLTSAVQRMHERRVGAVLVIEGERLVGVFTERDVLRAVAQGLDRTRPRSAIG